MLSVKLEQWINAFSELLGKISAALFVVMLFNVFYDVIMRYLFSDVSIGMQELEWHLYAAVFLLGVPYTLKTGGHVRVDLIYERLSVKRRAWVDMLGSALLLMPFCLLVGWYGIGFTLDAYQLGEGSGDPGGLPHRWIIKGMIPFAFFATAISGLGLFLGSLNTILDRRPADPSQAPQS